MQLHLQTKAGKVCRACADVECRFESQIEREVEDQEESWVRVPTFWPLVGDTFRSQRCRQESHACQIMLWSAPRARIELVRTDYRT